MIPLQLRCALALLVVLMSFTPQIAAVQIVDEPESLTPPPPPQPRVNGAKVFGVRPDHPLLYTIAATGQRPMRFSIADLPEGLQVDRESGQISGSLPERGTYRVMLRAENSLGHAERELRIVVGDELLLTPLLGCNTWGGWGAKVTDDNLRAAAKAIVDTGLINHGWQYINIDDGWQGHRGGPYNAIMPNERFPDMKALCDEIQGRRAKAIGGEAVIKQLEDGSKAVGLLNPGASVAKVSIEWSMLGLKGEQQVRDLWRQKDLGVHAEKFTAEVRPHGVVLVRLTAKMDLAVEPDEVHQSQEKDGQHGAGISRDQ